MGLRHDLRHGLRILRRSPGFTAAAVLTLALGIGANTAVFSLVDALLLRPLPYPDPERLAVVWLTGGPGEGDRLLMAPGTFADFASAGLPLEALGAISPSWTHTLTGQGEPENIQAAYVSEAIPRLLGAAPALGRPFAPEEHRAGAPPAALLGAGLWQRRFGSDPGVLGKALLLDGVARTVVGVLPAGAVLPGTGAEVWLPLASNPFGLENRSAAFLRVLARLGAGDDPRRAQAALEAAARRIGEEHPRTSGGRGARLEPLREALAESARPTLVALFGAVSLVLLIACANLSALLVARGAARRREIAVRAALGAGRARLVRQLLAESALLAVLGGAAGCLLALWGVDALRALAPPDLALAGGRIGVDARVLAYALGASLLCALLAGLPPALQASRADLNASLKQAGPAPAGPGRWLRGGLVVGEMALALALSIGAGLLIVSLHRLSGVDPGFPTGRLLAIGLSLPESRYPTREARAAFYEELLERLERLPGALSVGAVNRLPLGGSNLQTGLRVEGKPEPPGTPPLVDRRVASPGYFRAAGIPLASGRAFDERDRADSGSPVAIVNGAAARRFWPGDDPIGRRLRLEPGMDGWATVVGVTGDVRHRGLDSEAQPEVYVPYAQAPVQSMSVVVRTASDPLDLAGPARAEVRSLDRDLPLDPVRSMEQVVSESVAQPRFRTLLLALFAGVALALAAVGVSGVVSWWVEQRRREIGIRMALGARAGDVVRMVLARALALALAGVAAGVPAAIALARSLSGLLYGVGPADPATFAALSLLLVLVAIAACAAPALRAARVDPAVALRAE